VRVRGEKKKLLATGIIKVSLLSGGKPEIRLS
jgi:hypothetical protein